MHFTSDLEDKEDPDLEDLQKKKKTSRLKSLFCYESFWRAPSTGIGCVVTSSFHNDVEEQEVSLRRGTKITNSIFTVASAVV